MIKLREICAILGRPHTMEIVANLRCAEKFLKQITEETGVPYTTVQARIADMEAAGMVITWREPRRGDGKAVKKVRLKPFKQELSPTAIQVWLDETEADPGHKGGHRNR